MLFQVVTAFGNMLVLVVRKTKNSRGKSRAYNDKSVLLGYFQEPSRSRNLANVSYL